MQLKLNWSPLQDESVSLKTGASITYTKQSTANTSYGFYWIGVESYLDSAGKLIGSALIKAKDINGMFFNDVFTDVDHAITLLEGLETRRKMDAYTLVKQELETAVENVVKPVEAVIEKVIEPQVVAPQVPKSVL